MSPSNSSRVSSIVTDFVWSFSFALSLRFSSSKGMRCTETNALARESYKGGKELTRSKK